MSTCSSREFYYTEGGSGNTMYKDQPWVLLHYITLHYTLFTVKCTAWKDSSTLAFIHSVIHSFIPHNLWEFRAIWKTAAATAASTVQSLIQVSRQYSSLSVSLFFSLSHPFYSLCYCGPFKYTHSAQLQGLLIVHINHYDPVSENNPRVENTRVLLLLLLLCLTQYATAHILNHLPSMRKKWSKKWA